MQYTLRINEETNIPLTNVTITDPLPGQFKYLGPGFGTPNPTSVTGGPSGQTLTWQFASPADDATLTEIANGVLTLTVNVQAVGIGNNIVNTATGSAIDEFGNSLQVNPGSTTNTVVAEAVPSAQGLHGDIHAGGGPCGSAQTPGFVQSVSGSNSYGQYAVSASGNIADFGSNGSNNGTLLNLGTNGSYSEVCENDLYTAAINGASTVISTTLPGNTPGNPYDISGWSGVYYINGNAYIDASSMVQNKMTIVDRGGSVYIIGNISLTTASQASRSVPSIGIISENDINIYAAVTHIDAYLFAQGVIDTCLLSSGSCSTPTLDVEGFLMGQNILFHRLGPLNALGSPLSEQITLNPQIYLNPPLFFDASNVDPNSLNGQGEKQPLF